MEYLSMKSSKMFKVLPRSRFMIGVPVKPILAALGNARIRLAWRLRGMGAVTLIDQQQDFFGRIDFGIFGLVTDDLAQSFCRAVLAAAGVGNSGKPALGSLQVTWLSVT